ncbi:MAG: hypothetical protein ABL888_07540 [Pirellulaceae bacterium]
MPRFVVLRHSLPAESERPTHWDWMFELNGVLETWATEPLEQLFGPSELIEPISVIAQRLADHRLEYLEYEGPVSGNRGSVARILRGTYTCLDQSPRHRRLSVEELGYVIEFDIASDEKLDAVQLHLLIHLIK